MHLFQVICDSYYSGISVYRDPWDQEILFVISDIFCLLYQIYFVISVVNKQYKTKEINSLGLDFFFLLYQIFCYIRSLYIEFPLYPVTSPYHLYSLHQISLEPAPISFNFIFNLFPSKFNKVQNTKTYITKDLRA